MQHFNSIKRNKHILFRRNLANLPWGSVRWLQVQKQVTKLQGQIYLAKLRGNNVKLRVVQRKMINSKCNLLSAIRKVTSINRGKQTAGIDKMVYTTPSQRSALYQELGRLDLSSWIPCPARRIYIPRPGKTPRPIGIPNIKDRVIQAVVKNALEPEWEAVFEHGSYGFRPNRCPHDAMARIWRIMSSKKRRWIVDADIQGCFNNIAHAPLLHKLDGFPARDLIERWLSAGYFNSNTFTPTDIGTPQGGIISPLLANIALHGMENLLGVKYHKDGYIRSELPFVPIRYADDFVVFCNSESEALRAKDLLAKWLSERGMEFASDKTNIRHIQNGFDFLGWNFRLFTNLKGKGKKKNKWMRAKGKQVALVKPSHKSIMSIKYKMKELWRRYIGKEAWILISKLNPILRGWAEYHKYANSNKTFRSIDNFSYLQEVRYIKRKHGRKSWKWLKNRYFTVVNARHTRKTGIVKETKRSWTFKDGDFSLIQLRTFQLMNYSSIAYGRNPYNPADKEYFLNRKLRATLAKNSLKEKLFQRQGGFCPVCTGHLVASDWAEPLHVHHLVTRKHGGSDHMSNLMLLHEECHYTTHRINFSKVDLEAKLEELLARKHALTKFDKP